MNPEILLLVTLVFVTAGTIKGLAGIGLPTVAIGLMSQFIDPRLAISLTLGPLLLTNFWQAYRSGQILRVIKQYRFCILSLGMALYLSAQFAQEFETDTIILLLGLVVMGFSLISLFYRPPHVPGRYDRPGQILVGLTGGALGGMTAIWGPPVLIFLISRRVEKEEFVRVVGVILTCGALPLIWSYWQAGWFAGTNALISLALAVPAVAGFALGERFRARIPAKKFQRMLLFMFLILGANLIRRSLF